MKQNEIELQLFGRSLNRVPSREGVSAKRNLAIYRRSRLSNQSGQSMVEYLLVTAVVVLITLGVFTLMENTEYIYKNLTSPLVAYLKFNYKYGDRNASGWDEGAGPRRHIQISRPNQGQSFRIFIPDGR